MNWWVWDTLGDHRIILKRQPHQVGVVFADLPCWPDDEFHLHDPMLHQQPRWLAGVGEDGRDIT